MPKKIIENLIAMYKEDIVRQKISINDPIQQLVGTAHIVISIKENEERLRELETELKN